ncbi:MAG TPA: hypothetical protein VI979_02310 [archaeon]|nr:hypothetical protein [archaeon]
MGIEYNGEPWIRVGGVRNYELRKKVPYSEALEMHPDIATHIQNAVERYNEESKDPTLTRAYPVSPREEPSTVPRDDRIVYVQGVHIKSRGGKDRKPRGGRLSRKWAW